ncbi:hypothetical protein QBC39DRAFT_64965 [Podospora conica]|nr:hypothetical protein QBC39DRAFT_64965 [Schizothecium conicum]
MCLRTWAILRCVSSSPIAAAAAAADRPVRPGLGPEVLLCLSPRLTTTPTPPLLASTSPGSSTSSSSLSSLLLPPPPSPAPRPTARQRGASQGPPSAPSGCFHRESTRARHVTPMRGGSRELHFQPHGSQSP